MSQLTTHILNTSTGKPAAKVTVMLERKTNAGWDKLAYVSTNEDGRITGMPEGMMEKGTYRLTFETGAYFEEQGLQSFYPHVCVEFIISDGSHYHVPLLISPYGYSTYRGS